MAANLTGMMAQLQSVLGQNPLAKGGVGDQLLFGGLSNMGQAIGGATGSKPESWMSQPSKQLYGREALSELDLSTTEGMMKGAEIYGMMGDTDKQMALSTAARQQQQAEQARKALQARRENLSQRALKLNMDGVAQEVLEADPATMKELSKTIGEEERKEAYRLAGEPGRRRMALDAGFTAEEYVRDLKDLPPEEFDKVINGSEATLKPMLNNKTGQIEMVPADKYGRIMVNGKRMRPNEAGYSAAPQVSKVFNEADHLMKGVAEQAVSNFAEFSDEANQARKSLYNNSKAQSLLDAGINTGPLANLYTMGQKAAVMFGMPAEWAADAARTEAFLATRLEEAGRVISLFGSGTGLSDADRERAEKIAAGDITMTEDALRHLLWVEREVNNWVLNEHNGIVDEMRSSGKYDDATLDMLVIPTVPGSTQAPRGGELSPSAMKYFKQ